MRKLLIAEHVAVFADELIAALRQDWDICVCTDGFMAVDMIKCTQPEALVIDMRLPNRDGFSVLAECFPDLPPAIVALSAEVKPYMGHAMARWGVDYLFEIPFDPAKVRLALDEMVGQSVPAKRTAQHLRVMGFRSGLDGYSCLIAAIPCLLRNPAQKLGKEVYNRVAQICGMTDDRDVERAIRFAINDAWKRRNITEWAKYFPVNEMGDVDRPKNKDFIRCLMNRI